MLAITFAPASFVANRYRIFPDHVIANAVALDVGLMIASLIVRTVRVERLLLGGCVAVGLILDFFGMFGLFDIIFKAGSSLRGVSLLLSAMIIWLANVSAFALAYWYFNEVARSDEAEPELLFLEGKPGSGNHGILDYIFVAATTALAFGPTDTPLSTTRMRVAMLTEALISFVIISLVAARAVNAID
jgi:uncharacterized membrane protein